MIFHVIIGSERTPKINGTKRGFRKAFKYFHGEHLEPVFKTCAAQSDVSHTPRSIEELQQGARNRATSAFLYGKNQFPDSPLLVGVGVEGGLFTSNGYFFLQSWSCVFDGRRTCFGASGAIEMPQILARQIMEAGKDLGELIDTFANQQNVKSQQGTWGVLTNNSYTREDSFEAAVFNALVPLLNHGVYGKGTEQ